MVEVAPVGVTTRARARARARNLAMTEGGEKGTDNGGAKRRKMSAEDIYSSSSLVDQLPNRRQVPENEVYQANSGQNESGPSQCSSNGTVAVANARGGSVTRSLVDLQAEIVEIESSVSSHQRKRERTPSSLTEEEEAQMDDLEEANMERQSAVRNSRRRSTKNIVQVPSHAELEDFFSVIEDESQKRFVDKYNFDIVKEVPLEGRYEWVELLKP